jgi:hypothetical protein
LHRRQNVVIDKYEKIKKKRKWWSSNAWRRQRNKFRIFSAIEMARKKKKKKRQIKYMALWWCSSIDW